MSVALIARVGRVVPPVRQKAASYCDHYHELRLQLEGDYAVVFRVYDEGWPIAGRRHCPNHG